MHHKEHNSTKNQNSHSKKQNNFYFISFNLQTLDLKNTSNTFNDDHLQ